MFSQDRFSLTRFSIGSEGNTIQVGFDGRVEMQSVSGAAVPILTHLFGNGEFAANAKGTISVPASFSVGAALEATSKMRANILVSARMSESVSAESYGSRNDNIAARMISGLSAGAWAGKTIPTRAKPSGSFLASAFASKDILAGSVASEVFTALSEAGKQATDRAVINITIPPGGELRIDADTYRVILDGENVLYAQAGDWIRLNREVRYLDVELASGGPLEGGITYQERFL